MPVAVTGFGTEFANGFTVRSTAGCVWGATGVGASAAGALGGFAALEPATLVIVTVKSTTTQKMSKRFKKIVELAVGGLKAILARSRRL